MEYYFVTKKSSGVTIAKVGYTIRCIVDAANENSANPHTLESMRNTITNALLKFQRINSGWIMDYIDLVIEGDELKVIKRKLTNEPAQKEVVYFVVKHT